MKRLLQLLIAATAAIMAGCSSDNLPDLQNAREKDPILAPHRVSLNEALNHADRYLEAIEGVRTRHARIPASVEILGGNIPTRSSQSSDTLLYVVNYANDQGFAVLAADDRLMPVYAISETGRLNMSDTTFNQGLATFFDLARSEAELITSQADGFGIGDFPPYVPDSTLVVDTTSFDIDDSLRKVVIGPFLKGNAPLWKQSYPFSSLIPTINGQYVQSGCTAIAIAQALCILKMPYNSALYPEYTINWDVAMNFPKLAEDGGLPRLIEVLGRPENLNLKYGTSSTSTQEDINLSIVRTMNNFNLNAQFSFRPNHVTNFWSNERVENSILKGYPVLINSYVKKYANENRTGNTSEDGHFWLIDGMLYTPGCRQIPDPDYGIQDQLFHCVWGWGGLSNGYFTIRKRILDGESRQPDKGTYGNKIINCRQLWHFILTPKQ